MVLEEGKGGDGTRGNEGGVMVLGGREGGVMVLGGRMGGWWYSEEGRGVMVLLSFTF